VLALQLGGALVKPRGVLVSGRGALVGLARGALLPLGLRTVLCRPPTLITGTVAGGALAIRDVLLAALGHEGRVAPAWPYGKSQSRVLRRPGRARPGDSSGWIRTTDLTIMSRAL
jgi:hypothetical protein